MSITLKKLSISDVGILLFLMAMYSIGTISAIRVSWMPTLALMVLSCGLLFFDYVLHKDRQIRLNKLMIVWIALSLLCTIGVMGGSSTMLLIFYLMCMAILLMSEKISIDTLYRCLKWVRIIGLVFAIGCYWQFLFPGQYYARLYPLFGAAYRQSIRRQFTFHKMCTGFTSQTAVAAQFIILGIMAALYLFPQIKSKNARLIALIELAVLGGGLLLTGKRSPLLNLGAAVIVVDMLTVKRSKRINRILMIALGMITALTAIYFLAPLFAGSRNSLVRLFEFTSIEDVGEASNGRLSLYKSALTEFYSHPIRGIGWGKFSTLYDITGVHNIYLQLLCENGIFGFLLAVSTMFFTLGRTIKMLKQHASDANTALVTVLKCSVFIQVYILVYGLFGNPLYDQNYLLMYCIGILPAVSASFHIAKYPTVIIKQAVANNKRRRIGIRFR